MIDRNTPSDPRLRERRGDLVGRSALLFALVVLVAVGGAGWYVLSSRPGSETAAASPSPRASTSPSPRTTPSPSPRTTPSPVPTITPAPTASLFAVDEPADVRVDGEVVGTVTASAPRYRPRTGGERAPEGSRFALVKIRYDATAPFSYRAADWLVVDAEGGRHPAAAAQPNEALGEGDLAAGATAEASIAFEVPADVDVSAIVLRGGGRDLLAFRVP